MRKTTLFFVLILGLITISKAQYSVLPKIGTAVLNINNEGAIADGKTINTLVIQKILDKAKEKGGKVIIPKGIYLCGPLTLYSNTELVLEKGAVLKLINDTASFPVSNERYLNFIQASNAHDVKISGEGTINGQGEIWWKATEAKTLKYRRPQLCYFVNIQRIEISGITFLNPPNTHLSLKNTEDVYIHNITIKAPANSHNTDGINISAKNCSISHCNISTGDDNIAINFGNKRGINQSPECENILIEDCNFGVGHGLSIGSFTSGGLKNLSVKRCSFDGTTSAIRIKTARGRGGVIEQISYADISIKNSKWPIFISEYYPKEPKFPQDDLGANATEAIPVYKNINFKNVTISNAQEAIKIWGIPESPIQNISFENVNISAKSGAKIYNANNIEFTNSSIKVEGGDRLSTYKAEIKGIN